ncbi:MAG: precorrin-2 C(20)-methyltransferase [Deltaproteobacteria bacterium]|nr:precorrin-2 C(20)-methyltransferase [Deltaproteobacteria bacterium]
MTATLYIIGTGPGDPELVTLKAINILKRSSVIVSPRGSQHGTSTALSIIKPVVPLADKEIVEIHFPMIKIRSDSKPAAEVLNAWHQAAQTVLSYLEKGHDVCFPTLGDPAIYSTGYYLYETICGIHEDTKVVFVPGVPAMSSCSASIGVPICLGDEMVAIIPATFADNRLREVLQIFDTIVLMKVHRSMTRLTDILSECNLLEQAILVEQAGTDRERVIENFEDIIERPHYFSTIIVRKKSCTAEVLFN